MSEFSNLPDPVLPIGHPKRAASGHTAEWSATHPELDYSICINCKRCYLVCPEGAIFIAKEGDHAGYPAIDYNYCKGCRLCAYECPKNALDGTHEDFI